MISNFFVTRMYVTCFLFMFAIKNEHVLGQELINNSSSGFGQQKVASATIYHARTKRKLDSTRHSKGLHHSEVTVKINIDSEEYILDLRLNEELISEDIVIRYQEDGRTVQHKPTIEEMDLCQYSGVVRDRPNSWAAVSTCRGVRGVIYDGRMMRHIEPAEGGISSKHFIYGHLEQNITHNNTDYDYLNDDDTEEQPLGLHEQNENNTRSVRHKRDALSSTDIRGPIKSNQWSRYVELALVVDQGVYNTLGRDIGAVYKHIMALVNIINSMYTPLNIFITLVDVEVWNDGNKITIDEDSLETLRKFLKYRRTRLKNNDSAHLITLQKFSDGIVGKAEEGVMCTHTHSGGIATYDDHPALLAATITHEMGHTFGMSHDDESCKCRDKRCIMSFQITDTAPTQWSDCSKRSLTRAFDRGADYCLRNKPKRLFRYPSCGNGIVEHEEQCDCGGLPAGAERNACHSCCDSSTCQFKGHASCASGECCDLKTCRLKSAGTMCRSAHKECDLPEYCTGHSEFCPRDVFKMDSTPCGKQKEAFCAGGSCKSHTTQCQLLWGPNANSSRPQCYKKFNVKGDKTGNCGYDWAKNKYKPCAKEDVRCGRLLCERYGDLEFGYRTHAELTNEVGSENGKTFQCSAARLDLGVNDIDPGLVPDGAKCGNNKMCYKQRCRSVADIRSQLAVCPSGCNGRGTCNSEGHCHCSRGFAPPDCKMPGPGGSHDSGPASQPRGPTHIEQAPSPREPDVTTKPKDPGNDGPPYYKPIPHPREPDDVEDPKGDGPTYVIPTPRPERLDDTTNFKDPKSERPSGKPTPRPKQPEITRTPKDPGNYVPSYYKPIPRPKNPDDFNNHRDPKSESPTSARPTPRPRRPDVTRKPKDPGSNVPIYYKPIPWPKTLHDTTYPQDPKGERPTSGKPTSRPKGPEITGKPKNPGNNVPTYYKPIPRPKTLDDSIIPEYPKGSNTGGNNNKPTSVESVPGTVMWDISNDNGDKATDPSSDAQKSRMVAIYVIFLGVLPLILIVIFLIYFRKIKEFFRNNKPRKWGLNYLDCKTRSASNNISFFAKFPRIHLDVSTNRIFFTYNNTFTERASQNMHGNINTNENNINIQPQRIPAVNILPSRVTNRNEPINKLRKTSGENLTNYNIREQLVVAVNENYKTDSGVTNIHTVKPKPPPKPKTLYTKVNNQNAATATKSSEPIATEEEQRKREEREKMTVKDRARLFECSLNSNPSYHKL